MANRRMFSRDVVSTDTFLDMPISAQALFFHLGMEGDDDGFVKNPKTVMRMIGAKPDDLNILSARGFIIPFQTGVIAIRHWRLMNTLRNDRYKPTTCIAERKTLEISGGIYDGCQSVAERLPDGCHVVAECEPQHNITQHNLTEHNGTEDNVVVPAKPKQPARHKYGEYENLLLTHEELEKLKSEYGDWAQRIERLSAYIASNGAKYKSHYATIRNWARKDAETVKKPKTDHGYQQHEYTADDFGDEFYYNPDRDFKR